MPMTTERSQKSIANDHREMQPYWSSIHPLGGRRQQYEKQELPGGVAQTQKLRSSATSQPDVNRVGTT